MNYLLIYVSGMVAFLVIGFIINRTKDEYMYTPLRIALVAMFASWVISVIFVVVFIVRHFPKIEIELPKKLKEFYGGEDE